tara:strand:- start:635 stop:976 length:342 start_codon:yes stop_codon:yes gene_type:complete
MPISDIHYQQRPLPFFTPTPAHNHTETSKDAAVAIAPKVSALQQRVLDTVKTSEDGLTRDQLANLCNLPTATICARANELVKLGKLKSKVDPKTGKKFTRPTRTGKNAEILFA